MAIVEVDKLTKRYKGARVNAVDGVSFSIEPGEFFAAHGMETDVKGNLYTTEVEDGKRIQKFVFKGLVWAPSSEAHRSLAVAAQ